MTTETRKRIWSECASTVIKVENILVKDRGDKSPYEMMFGCMPNYVDDLRTFGEIAIIKDNRNKLKSKLSNRGIEEMFVGYSEYHARNVYRFMNLKTNRIMTSRDVTWMHSLYKDYMKEERNEVKEIIIDDYDVHVKKNADEAEDQPKKMRIPRVIKELQASYNDATKTYIDMLEEDGKTFVGFALASEATTYPDERTTFQEAWNHEDTQEREGWQNAIKKEFQDMLKRGFWRRIKKNEVPNDRRTIGSK